MKITALILRRRYPVPVTFAHLRAAYDDAPLIDWVRDGRRAAFTAALKEVTGALDEVYAVVDGREVRVAVVYADGAFDSEDVVLLSAFDDLLNEANRAGYWERPHEVRLDLTTGGV